MKYIEPKIKVIELESSSLICTSDPEAYYYDLPEYTDGGDC